MEFGKRMKKIKEKLEKAGDLLLFWCVIFPILIGIWWLTFSKSDRKYLLNLKKKKYNH